MAQNNFNLAQVKALNEEYLRRIGYLPVATMPNGPFPRKNFQGKIHGWDTILYAQDVKADDVVHTGIKHGKVTSVAVTGTKVTINYTLIDKNVPAGVKPEDHDWLEEHVFVATKVSPGANGASDTGSYLKLAHTNLIFFRPVISPNVLFAGAGAFVGSASEGADEIVGNVLTASTLKSATATIANVTISLVTPSSQPTKILLNTATGAVTVKNATPVGVYTLVYRLTEKAYPSNVDEGTITVTVSA